MVFLTCLVVKLVYQGLFIYSSSASAIIQWDSGFLYESSFRRMFQYKLEYRNESDVTILWTVWCLVVDYPNTHRLSTVDGDRKEEYAVNMRGGGIQPGWRSLRPVVRDPVAPFQSHCFRFPLRLSFSILTRKFLGFKKRACYGDCWIPVPLNALAATKVWRAYKDEICNRIHSWILYFSFCSKNLG